MEAEFEVAKTIFEKAVKKYGTKMHYKQVDALIRRSDLRDRVDKNARKRLKALIYNYECNGFDAQRAVQLEHVRLQCS